MGRLRSILETCQPRSDIFAKDFQPEIFTPNLSAVLRYYRGDPTGLSDVYADSEKFFTDGTYPTQGLLTLFKNVLRRVTKGDGNVSGTSWVETGYGGGKTHGLIGIVHLVKGGTNLKHFVSFIEPDLLPSPDTVKVAGIVETEPGVHIQSRKKMKPYTLWGEIALQIGGHQLYEKIKPEVTSLSAPGKRYFDQVFGNCPCVLLFDELDQYATKLKLECPGSELQLCIFLRDLMEYAAIHNHLSVVITLGDISDTSGRVTTTQAQIPGSESVFLPAEDRLGREIRSLLEERDAITPVTSDELPKIMAKRLFENIDHIAAEKVAKEYLRMYLENPSIPNYARESKYLRTIEKHYPFHPGLIKLLDRKLGIIPTFQRIRGSLKMLTPTIRTIWNDRLEIPLIHSCHLDLSGSSIINELLGRINAGKSKTISWTNGSCFGLQLSRAQQLDRQASHPAKYPVHEWTWKVVLLQSLFEKPGDPGSSIAGPDEAEAVLETSFPGLEPPLVRKAFKAIDIQALCLRKTTESGEPFVSVRRPIERIIAETEKEIAEDQIFEFISEKSREMFSEVDGFDVFTCAKEPVDIPDEPITPKLAIIDIGVEKVSLKQFFSTVGDSPRINQNLVFLVVPRPVEVDELKWTSSRRKRISKEKSELKKAIGSYLACKKILDSTNRSGISDDSKSLFGIKQLCKKRKMEAEKMIFSLYDSIWYGDGGGGFARRKIAYGGYEGSSGEIIIRTLTKYGKLITVDTVKSPEVLEQAAKLFFEEKNELRVKDVKLSFQRTKSWPVCHNGKLLNELLRAGIEKGYWGIYREEMIGLVPTVYICTDKCKLPFPENAEIPDRWFVIEAKTVMERDWLPSESYRGIIPGRTFLEKEKHKPYKVILKDPYRVIKLLFRLDIFFERGAKSRISRIELKNLKLKGDGSLSLSLKNIAPEGISQVSGLFRMLGTQIIVDESASALLEIENSGLRCPLAESMLKVGAGIKITDNHSESS